MRRLMIGLGLGVPMTAQAQLTGNPAGPDLPLMQIGVIMLVMIGLGVALVLLLRHRTLGSLLTKEPSKHGIRLIDRVVLDARVTVYVVEVDSQRMVIAATHNALSMQVPSAEKPLAASPKIVSTGV